MPARIFTLLLLASASTCVAGEPILTDRSRLVVPFSFDLDALTAVGAEAVDLKVSVDGGPWTLTDSVNPAAGQFVYTAPRDGVYAFAMQVRTAAGRTLPGGPPQPGLTVRVRRGVGAVAAATVASNGRFSVEEPAPAGQPQVELVSAPPSETPAEPSWPASQAQPTPVAARPPVVASPKDVAPAPTLTAAAPQVLSRGQQRASIPAMPASFGATDVRPLPKTTGQAAMPARYADSMTPTRPDEIEEVISSLDFELAFEVDEVGPSGVQNVALYITEDDGRSWFHYGDDTDKVSPMAVRIPTDGRYGFAFRVTSGVGLASPPPQPGERPVVRLVADTQPPKLQLAPVTLNTNGGRQTVTVRWNATDANPAARGISIDVSQTAVGPWEEVAGGLVDSGSYDWVVPAPGPAAAFFRVRATDAAGLASEATTPQPVILDASRPRARVTAVTPIH